MNYSGLVTIALAICGRYLLGQLRIVVQGNIQCNLSQGIQEDDEVGSAEEEGK